MLAWFAVKPVRVFAPEFAGVSCLSASVCVDDKARFNEATRLYAEGLAFVSAEAGAAKEPPRMTFCASQACADSFGLGARSAVTLGTLGTIIGPRAWAPHYIRHELIHYVQAERLGVISLLFKPQWFVEGMAYALSQDPRTPLAEPFESHRKKFLSWYGGIENAGGVASGPGFVNRKLAALPVLRKQVKQVFAALFIAAYAR